MTASDDEQGIFERQRLQIQQEMADRDDQTELSVRAKLRLEANGENPLAFMSDTGQLANAAFTLGYRYGRGEYDRPPVAALDEAIAAVVNEGLTRLEAGLQRQEEQEPLPPDEPDDLVLRLINRADRYVDELKNHTHCSPELCDRVHVNLVETAYEQLLIQLVAWNGQVWTWLNGGDGVE